MLSKKEKQKIIEDFRISEKDTGSVKLQIALLTKDILKLSEHFKQNSHDYASKRGLLKKVGQRRRFLNYLHRNNVDEYKEVIKKLKLKR